MIENIAFLWNNRRKIRWLNHGHHHYHGGDDIPYGWWFCSCYTRLSRCVRWRSAGWRQCLLHIMDSEERTSLSARQSDYPIIVGNLQCVIWQVYSSIARRSHDQLPRYLQWFLSCKHRTVSSTIVSMLCPIVEHDWVVLNRTLSMSIWNKGHRSVVIRTSGFMKRNVFRWGCHSLVMAWKEKVDYWEGCCFPEKVLKNQKSGRAVVYFRKRMTISNGYFFLYFLTCISY